MNELFEKARIFANELLETKEGKAFEEARYILEGDDQSVAMLQEYTMKTQQFQVKLSQGEQDETLANELNELAEKMKQNEAIIEFFNKESAFYEMVSRVMEVFNATITGASEEGGCSGGCSSCSGCH